METPSFRTHRWQICKLTALLILGGPTDMQSYSRLALVYTGAIHPQTVTDEPYYATLRQPTRSAGSFHFRSGTCAGLRPDLGLMRCPPEAQLPDKRPVNTSAKSSSR